MQYMKQTFHTENGRDMPNTIFIPWGFRRAQNIQLPPWFRHKKNIRNSFWLAHFDRGRLMCCNLVLQRTFQATKRTRTEMLTNDESIENPCNNVYLNRGEAIFGFETSSRLKFLRLSDLKQPQLPETRLKIDFDRFFRFISGRIFI